jgi:hypothetical protein
MPLPTRLQQLGLLVALTLVVIYAIVRLVWRVA